MTEESINCPSCGTELPAGFKFCGNCGRQIEVSARPQAAAAPAPAIESAVRDERRDVTVVFADVSGFTAMSERLDPEKVHTIMNACFEGLGVAIDGEGGHIDKYIGDNIMALFGAPLAHDDDPLRAVRAALAMQLFLAGFAEENREETGVSFSMRIGVHCGLVLAGNVGASVRRDYSVMGDTVNLASRLESAARPGSILVSEETMRRTRGQFAFGPAQHLSVKGKAEKVHAYELVRELTEIEAGFDSPTEAPFVGRRDCVERIISQWSERKARVSKTWVSGPSGIGKTRLVETSSQEAGVRLLRVTARSATRQRPLGLVRRILQSVLSVGDTGEAVPETFEGFAAAIAPLSRGLESHLGALWYLAAPDRVQVSPPDPDPQVLRQTIQHGFARVLSNLASVEPGVVVFADAFDDCDPASAELLEHLPDTGSALPPITVAARSEPSATEDWLHVEVPPLAPQEVDEVLEHRAYASSLGKDLRADLVNRCGGVPLYLEEMLSTLIAQRVVYPVDDGWTCNPDASAAILPESLFGAMVARLDALLTPLRRLIKECAVQGTEFRTDVAREVSRANGGEFADVEAQVEGLRENYLVDPDPYRPIYWNFRQSLMQAACYETLLMSERKRLHDQTATALADIAGGFQFVSPVSLAHHFELAESWIEAAAANYRAGERSAVLFANAEAADRYTRAIELAQRAGEAAAAIALDAYDGAAILQLRLGDYDEVEGLATRLLELARTPLDRARGHRHFAAACFHTGRGEDARGHLTNGLKSLSETDPEHGVMISELHFDLARLDLREAGLPSARDHAETSRRFRNPSDQGATVRLDIIDGRIAHTEGRFTDAVRHYTHALETANRLGSVSEQARSCNHMGDVSRDIGDYHKAQELFSQALVMWERIGEAEGIAGAHNNLANLAMSRGELSLARHHHRHALTAFSQIGNVHGSALARANLAILAIESGEGGDAIEQARLGLALLGEEGSHVLRSLTEIVLGEGYLETGALDAAEEIFQKVFDASGETPLTLAGAARGLGACAVG